MRRRWKRPGNWQRCVDMESRTGIQDTATANIRELLIHLSKQPTTSVVPFSCLNRSPAIDHMRWKSIIRHSTWLLTTVVNQDARSGTPKLHWGKTRSGSFLWRLSKPLICQLISSTTRSGKHIFSVYWMLIFRRTTWPNRVGIGIWKAWMAIRQLQLAISERCQCSWVAHLWPLPPSMLSLEVYRSIKPPL